MSRRVARRWLQARQFQAPPKMVEAITEWAQQTLAEHLLAKIPEYRSYYEDEIRELKEDPDPEDLEDMLKLTRQSIADLVPVERYLRKYASKAKVQKDHVSRPFKLNLDGWRYVEGDPKAAYAFARSHGWDPLEASLVFKGWKHGSTTQALFRSYPKVEILMRAEEPTFPTVPALVKIFDHLARSVRHEMQHYAQDLLSNTRYQEGHTGMPWSQAGGPRKKVRETAPSYKLPHARNDPEYQPRLSDEISEFTSLARQHDLSGKRLKDAMRLWTSGRRALFPGIGFISEREFWKALNTGNRPKWQSAAKTFYSEVMRNLPS